MGELCVPEAFSPQQAAEGSNSAESVLQLQGLSNRPEDWLAHAYPTNDDISKVCNRAGIPEYYIPWKSAAAYTWPEVLRLAGNMLKLNQLWDVVTSDPTKAHYHKKFREFQKLHRDPTQQTPIDERRLYDALCQIDNVSTGLDGMCTFSVHLKDAQREIPNKSASPSTRAMALIDWAKRRGVLKQLLDEAKHTAPGYF